MHRRASALRAGASPPLDRTAGWIPREIYFGRHRGHSCHQSSDPLLERLQFVRHARFGGPQLEAQCNQSLLGAVVQVVFYTAARIIGGRDDTSA